MNPLFYREDFWSRFNTALRSWIGTPYRHRQMTKGKGADCTTYIGQSLLEAGILTKVTIPKYYPKDWFATPDFGDMLKMEVEKNLAQHLARGLFYEVYDNPEPPEPVRGDICLFSMRPDTGIVNHSGVVLDDKTMIHVSQRANVRSTSYGETWRNMQTVTFRLLEV